MLFLWVAGCSTDEHAPALSDEDVTFNDTVGSEVGPVAAEPEVSAEPGNSNSEVDAEPFPSAAPFPSAEPADASAPTDTTDDATMTPDETTATLDDGTEGIHITLEIAEESIQRRAVLYDKEGDYHFDTISAFIKSLRGSDPDAALYWMAKMVYAGESPRFIFRRMLIFAGEDVGMADPNAIAVVVACANAFEQVGMPEGRFHLAEAALYLATAKKSNTAFAFFEALEQVEKEADSGVPPHLRDVCEILARGMVLLRRRSITGMRAEPRDSGDAPLHSTARQSGSVV